MPGPRDPEGDRPPPARPPRQCACPSDPAELDARTDRWALAERQAYDADAAVAAAAERPEPGLAGLVERLVAGLDDTDLGREHLVHADLAGNVLLDAAGTPFVIDLSPAWRSPLWAEAVCVLDAVLWLGAPGTALDDWRTGVERQAMLRARCSGCSPTCRATSRATQALDLA